MFVAYDLVVDRSILAHFTRGVFTRTVKASLNLTNMQKSVKIVSMGREGGRIGTTAPRRSTIKHISKAEVRRFIRAIPRENLRDRVLFDLVYHYALRRSEVCLLQLEDIRLQANEIFIHRVKGGDSHTYPLFPGTRRLLTRYVAQPRKYWTRHLFPSRQRLGEAISASLVAYLFRLYAAAANLPADRRHVHVLRHSMAMHLGDAGIDGVDIQDWMAHTSFDSTRVYMHTTAKRRAKTLRRLIDSEEIA